MTLLEMSVSYRNSASVIHERIAELRALERAQADPEEALNAATEKFISRFAKVEALASAQGKDMNEMSLSELDALWEQVKRQ